MKITLAAKDAIHIFDARPGERLLYAGLRAGVPIPYECATGTCGSCKARLTDGQVDELWPEAPGHGGDRRAPAGVLLCQTAAASDCALLLDKAKNSAHAPPGYLTARVSRIDALVHDVMLVELVLDQPVAFAPGQFMLCGIAGLSGWRAYSICEGVASDRVSFIVKRKPDGAMTRWFFESCLADTPVQLFGPLGAATFRAGSDEDMVLLAGASGVSMVLSILEAATRIGHTARYRADVVFGVRTPADAFCLDQLSHFVAVAPELVHVTVALSEPSDASSLAAAHPLLRFEQGFVHQVAAAVVPRPAASAVGFIAGPPPMIDASLRYLLLQARIALGRIRYDKFS